MGKLKYTEGKFDPFDLNSILLDSTSGISKLIPDAYNVMSFLGFIFLTLYKIIEYIVYPLVSAPLRLKIARISDYKEWYNNTILFRVPTLNNKRSLERIYEIVNQKRENVKVMESGVRFGNYPVFLVVLRSIPYLPTLWKQYQNMTPEKKRIISYYVKEFVLARGVTWFYFHILEKYRPECVVISNDHMYYVKSLELVCEYYGVRTIYIQHASVSYAFPELHFKYSFLDGMDALDKYTSEGKSIPDNIILIGAVRYDALSQYRINRVNRNRNCIGIAINQFDDNNEVNDLCNILFEDFPKIKIKVRSHPALKNTPFKFDKKDRIIYTCATDEPAVSFFDDIDVLVSNDSGIHFDAFIAGVPTLAFNFSKMEFGDNYNYVKNGILKLAMTAEEVSDFYVNRFSYTLDMPKIKEHDESYGKSYAGNCSGIVADFMLNGYSMDYLKSKYKAKYHQYKDGGYYIIPS